MYQILPYSKKQAKRLGVKIKSSIRKNKKIDVYTIDGNYITSIGDNRYLDYPTYLKIYGKKYADARRSLYHMRHQNDKNDAGFLAKEILW